MRERAAGVERRELLAYRVVRGGSREHADAIRDSDAPRSGRDLSAGGVRDVVCRQGDVAGTDAHRALQYYLAAIDVLNGPRGLDQCRVLPQAHTPDEPA